MNAQNAIGVDKAPGRSVVADHGKADAGCPSSPAVHPATSPARQQSMPAPEASAPLSPQEQAEYDRCCAVIKQGPHTAAVIGEALWRVDSQRLYRDQFASMKTFFFMQTDLEPDDGFKLIADWQATNSRATTGAEPVLGRHREDAPTQERLSTGPMPRKPTSSDTTPTQPKPAIMSVAEQPLASAPQTKEAVSALIDKPLPTPRLPARAKVTKAQHQPPGTTASSATPVDVAEAVPINPMRRMMGAKSPSTTKNAALAPAQPDTTATQATATRASTGAAAPTTSPSSTDSDETTTAPLKVSDQSVVSLLLTDITVDESIQCRASLHKATVSEYGERMKAGDKFPALVVYNIDGRHVLADGFHRYRAAEQAGLASLPVEVREGTRRDAIKFAIEANAVHGLARTNKDKRRSVELALQELTDLSDGVLAELCKVTQPYVSKVRRELKTVLSCATRTGRDGKKRSMPKKKKARSEQNQSAGTKATEASSSAGQQAAGTASDESDETTTSHEGATGQEQATQAQSSGDSDEQDTGEGQSAYSLDGAWSRISELLMQEFKRCPESMRTELAERLGRFIDRQT